jgi:hypothetical protein
MINLKKLYNFLGPELYHEFLLETLFCATDVLNISVNKYMKSLNDCSPLKIIYISFKWENSCRGSEGWGAIFLKACRSRL